MNAVCDRAPVASTPSSSLWSGNAARSPSRAGHRRLADGKGAVVSVDQGERHEWRPGKMRVVLSHGA